MFARVTAKLTTDALAGLMEYNKHSGESEDLESAIGAAVEFFLAHQCDGKDESTAPPVARGYRWKELFLPAGTLMRMWCDGYERCAHVEGDRLMHEGCPMSPQQFANLHARSTRNAWRDLHLRLPGTRNFRPASELRREARREEAPAPAVLQTVAPAAAQPTAIAPAPAPSPPAAPPPETPLFCFAAQSPAAIRYLAAPLCIKPSFQGWTLHERRKRRYLLEDIPFD
jgi:hypothetical protein